MIGWVIGMRKRGSEGKWMVDGQQLRWVVMMLTKAGCKER
jgi:hypothetical protein